MVYPVAHMAPPAAIPHQPSPLPSPESDPSEASASTSSSSFALGSGEHPPGDPETADPMENGFLSSESI